MTTPLLLKAAELNTLIWRYGPCARFPLLCNPPESRFEAEISWERNFLWFLCSTVYFGLTLLGLIFIVTVALKAPHIDRMQNWIATFEEFPIVVYIVLYTGKL